MRKGARQRQSMVDVDMGVSRNRTPSLLLMGDLKVRARGAR